MPARSLQNKHKFLPSLASLLKSPQIQRHRTPPSRSKPPSPTQEFPRFRQLFITLKFPPRILYRHSPSPSSPRSIGTTIRSTSSPTATPIRKRVRASVRHPRHPGPYRRTSCGWNTTRTSLLWRRGRRWCVGAMAGARTTTGRRRRRCEIRTALPKVTMTQRTR
jgi:hypothetical protein